MTLRDLQNTAALLPSAELPGTRVGALPTLVVSLQELRRPVGCRVGR